MLDPYSLIDWAIVVGFLVGLPVIARRAFDGEATAAWLHRVAERTPRILRAAEEPVDPDEELLRPVPFDPRPDTLRRLLNLMATDEHMSATRQLANRLAYYQLVHELSVRPPVAPPLPPVPVERIDPEWCPQSATAAPRPMVETIDIGWR